MQIEPIILKLEFDITTSAIPTSNYNFCETWKQDNAQFKEMFFPSGTQEPSLRREWDQLLGLSEITNDLTNTLKLSYYKEIDGVCELVHLDEFPV